MKSLLVTVLLTLGLIKATGQQVLDSGWKVGAHNFRLRLVINEESFPLNTKMILEKGLSTIFSDSVFTSHLYGEGQDMNSDGYNDLLVYQSSGARANEVYFLYLFDPKESTYRRVNGYEEWPNMQKTKVKGLLSSTILTGTVQYRYFKISESGELIDLGISETDLDLDGKEYEKGIKRAKKKLNNSYLGVQHGVGKSRAEKHGLNKLFLLSNRIWA